jgi:TonB family protein
LRPRGFWAQLLRSVQRVVVLGFALVMIEVAAGPPKAAAQEASAGEVAKRKVKTRVAPEYTALARQTRATGKVKIEVTISADGHVTSTRTIGGSPLLVAASVDALKKWRFEPGPKETTEIIEFDFSPQ